MDRATSIQKSNNRQGEKAESHAQSPPRQSVPISLQEKLLALQRAVGNQSVDLLMRGNQGEASQERRVSHDPSSAVHEVIGSPGQPLDKDIREHMESRFGQDFSHVRIHIDDEAEATARAVHAKSYTVGHDVVFSQGRYAPHSLKGRQLIAHELAHVVQQERGGSRPEVDPTANHERAADDAARAAVAGKGPVSVAGATGVGVARAPEDWLEGTPNIQTWTPTQLIDEIDEINQWLGDQIQSTPESIRLEEALEELQTELNKKTIGKPPARGRKRGRRRKGRKRAVEPISEPELRKPRILREQTSVQYEDPSELREEIDLILAWLQREDLTRADRDILQMELQNLAPALEESRVQKVAGRRAAKIERALTPKVSEDARAQLVEAVKLIDSIKPLSERPGYSYLMHGEEMIVLHDSEVEAIRSGITGMMDEAAKKIDQVNDGTFQKYEIHAKLNYEESPVVGFIVSLFVGEDPVDVFDRMNPFRMKSENKYHEYLNLRRQGKLVAMAEAIAEAEKNAVKAKLIVDDWVDETISTAGDIVTGLTITRDLSFAIVTSYFGGAGFVSLARSGAGLLRAGATVTAIGAGSNAIARGGTNLAGQALAGGGIDFAEVRREVVAGAKRGAVDALTGAVTGGTSSVLGQGTTVAGRVGRGALSGFAGGTAGGTAEATLEGKSASEIAKSGIRVGVSGTIGGAFGGASSSALSSRSGVTRVLAGSASGATGSAAGTLLTGGSAEEIKRSAITGAITGGVTAAPSAQPRRPAPPVQRPVRRPSPLEHPESGGDIDRLIGQLESGGETGGVGATGPGVRIPVRRSPGHSPVVAQPPARVLEVGAGRRKTDLRIPSQRRLVAITRTDIRGRKGAAVSTRGVRELDATRPIPPEFVGQFDTIIINNPRNYAPNIAELGRALRPGGRIIVQGRGAVHRKQRSINPDFQRLLDEPPPPGFRKIVEPEQGGLPPPPRGAPQNIPSESILGGPFYRTTGTGEVYPNARIIYERLPPGPPPSR